MSQFQLRRRKADVLRDLQPKMVSNLVLPLTRAQRAAYVFHFDRWWNPAVERQAEDCTHRLGQTQPVHVYR